MPLLVELLVLHSCSGHRGVADHDHPFRRLQVYLRQLVCVTAAWRVQQLTGFLDERASMMGLQGQISDVLDQVDRMESLCVDLQHQVCWHARYRLF